MRYGTRAACALALIGAAVPAAAWAGAVATAGDQQATLSASLTPAKAKAKGVTLGLKVSYASTTGTQIQNVTKGIVFTLPKGMVVNPAAATQCPFATVRSSGAASCPASSVVGGGTATIDARGLGVSGSVTVPVTIYNVLGVHNDLLFDAKTPLGAYDFYFKILPAPRELLSYGTTPPSGGYAIATYGLTGANVKITGNAKGTGSFVTNPSGCGRGPWKFFLAITSYPTSAGGVTPPQVTAADTVPCTH